MGRVTPPSSEPKKLLIARELAERIARGETAVGEPLPSRSTLAEKYDVSPGTVQSAINQLRAAGVVQGAPGKAVYVRRVPTAADLEPLRVIPVDDRLADHEQRIADLETLRKRVGRLEADLRSLYASTHVPYPDTEKPARRRRVAGGGVDG